MKSICLSTHLDRYTCVLTAKEGYPTARIARACCFSLSNGRIRSSESSIALKREYVFRTYAYGPSRQKVQIKIMQIKSDLLRSARRQKQRIGQEGARTGRVWVAPTEASKKRRYNYFHRKMGIRKNRIPVVGLVSRFSHSMLGGISRGKASYARYPRYLIP